MPRLLPRLLKYLSENKIGCENYQGVWTKKALKRRSLYKPRVSHSSPLFLHRTPLERERSLLLDPKETNVLFSPENFKPHKTLPPRVSIRKTSRRGNVDHDRPRAMTEEERSWWANPYLRMLSSPLRMCVKTRYHLPTDFLLRLEPMLIPGGKRLSLVPHGIQHPRFVTRSLALAKYIACSKETVRSYLSLRSQFQIEEFQIGQQLRLRVLQELQMLANRLACSSKIYSKHNVLRRLTRVEWDQVRTKHVIPWEGAVCVIVLPPPNKNKTSGERPPAVISDHPPEDHPAETVLSNPLPFPMVQMCLKEPSNLFDETFRALDDAYVPHHRIPLYHGLAMFPDPSHRAAIHDGLCRILQAEYKTRRGRPLAILDEKTRGKRSHAFLLSSTAKTQFRADSVPLSIALWRLKLWEAGLQ